MRFLTTLLFTLFAIVTLLGLTVNGDAQADAQNALHQAKVKAGIEDPTVTDRVKNAAATAQNTVNSATHQAKVKVGAENPTIAEQAQATAQSIKDKTAAATHAAKVKTGIEEPTLYDQITGHVNNLHAAVKPHVDVAQTQINKASAVAQDTFASLRSKVNELIGKQEL